MQFIIRWEEKELEERCVSVKVGGEEMGVGRDVRERNWGGGSGRRVWGWKGTSGRRSWGEEGEAEDDITLLGSGFM